MTDVTAQAFREAADATLKGMSAILTDAMNDQIHGEERDGAWQVWLQHEHTLRVLLLAAAEQREQLDAMQSRTFDYPTAWTLTRMTKIEQHHEKCSYRVSEGGILCDCIGIDAFEIMVRGGRQ